MLFLSEILYTSLKEEESNVPLFTFLETSLQWLDTHQKPANFSIYFLLQLTKYLGFYPEMSYGEALRFNMLEGEFTNTKTSNDIEGEVLTRFKSFLGIQFDALHHIQLNKQQRQELLKILITYFELHLQGFKKPKSLEVLNELFN